MTNVSELNSAAHGDVLLNTAEQTSDLSQAGSSGSDVGSLAGRPTVKKSRKEALSVDIGKRLRIARERAGLTINDVSSILGWDRQTIGTWETGFAYPPIKKLREMCRLYRVSLDYIVNGNPEDGEWEHHLQALPDSIRDNAIALAERSLVNELTGLLRQMSDEELAKMLRILPILGKLNAAALQNVEHMLTAMFGMLEQIVEERKN